MSRSHDDRNVDCGCSGSQARHPLRTAPWPPHTLLRAAGTAAGDAAIALLLSHARYTTSGVAGRRTSVAFALVGSESALNSVSSGDSLRRTSWRFTPEPSRAAASADSAPSTGGSACGRSYNSRSAMPTAFPTAARGCAAGGSVGDGTCDGSKGTGGAGVALARRCFSCCCTAARSCLHDTHALWHIHARVQRCSITIARGGAGAAPRRIGALLRVVRHVACCTLYATWHALRCTGGFGSPRAAPPSRAAAPPPLPPHGCPCTRHSACHSAHALA